MILTDKAKTEFWKWFLPPETLRKNGLSSRFANENRLRMYFLALPESCQHALIIEWFINIGIVITFDYERNTKQYFGSVLCLNSNKRVDVIDNHREKYYKKALEKANEIFNLKKTKQ